MDLSCKTCIHYRYTRKDVPRCAKFKEFDTLTKKICDVETSIARFPDFDLCGPEGKFYQSLKDKKTFSTKSKNNNVQI